MKNETITICIKCPVCGKTISLVLNKPKKGNIGRVAINHEDHIIVIDYDIFGHIRCVNVFKRFPIPQTGEILCRICKKPIEIRKDELLHEYAYIHDDHVVVVYVFNEHYQIEILPLAKVTQEPLYNIVDELIKQHGIKKISGIITHALIHSYIVLSIELKYIQHLFLQLKSLRNTIILFDDNVDDTKYENFSNPFIESVLVFVKNLSYVDALKKLDDMLLFILNLASMINKHNDINSKVIISLIEKIPNKALRDLILSVANVRKNDTEKNNV